MKSLWVLISLLCFSLSSWGQGLCREVLFLAPFESHHLIQETRFQFSNDHDVILVKTKDHEEWGDYRDSSDIPGDVRAGVVFVPAAIKKLLGLKAFDQHGTETDALSEKTAYLQLPKVQKVRQVLLELEMQIRKSDSEFQLIHFAETGSHHLGRMNYLRTFASKSELPFSVEGALYEHDLNFHVYSSLVLPPKVLKALRNRADIVLNFLDFVRAHEIPGIDSITLAKTIEKKMIPDIVTRIDVGTGNLFVALEQMKSESIETLMSVSAYQLELMFAGRTSPKMYLIKMLEEAKLSSQVDEVMKVYLRQLPEQWTQEDLSMQFLNNPSELYNDGRRQLKMLEEAASKVASKKN